ncbi:MAG: hypothetical protein ACLFPF_05285 [Halanaerobiales bacterium]
MKWLNKLQRKYGRYAIKNLMLYIVFLTGAVYLIDLLDPTGRFLGQLTLVPSRVMQGEIWRLITYVFVPPTRSIFIIFALYFYYMIGSSLERVWGSFKFNMYYLIGIAATTVVAFLTNGVGTPVYLNLTLFLAFARLYPNFQILLFFILPVKMKYLAWITWAYFGLIIIQYLGGLVLAVFSAGLRYPDSGTVITLLIALSNYFIFFGQDIIKDIKLKGKVQKNRRKFQREKYWDHDEAIHECHVCGITEKDDSRMSFRYCSKCDGAYEYCEKHLENHEHVKE